MFRSLHWSRTVLYEPWYRLYINMAGGVTKGSHSFIYGDQSAKPSLLINADVIIKNGS